MAVVIRDAETYFGEYEKDRYARYVEIRKQDMKNAGIPVSQAKEYFEVLLDFKKSTLAVDALSKQYNALVDEAAELKQKYSRAQTKAERDNLLKEYNRMQTKMEDIKAVYDHYRNRYLMLEPEAARIGELIDTRLEERGFDKGLDERAKKPNQPRTSKPRK